jgi:CheY-like chemotaxis protein
MADGVRDPIGGAESVPAGAPHRRGKGALDAPRDALYGSWAKTHTEGALPACDAERDRGTMNALGSQRLSEDARPGSPPRGDRSGITQAVLWAENVDTRLLLRGLLRLHRHPVVHEVASLEELVRLPPSADPTILVVAVESEDDGWERRLTETLKRHPELRPVVILPRESAGLEPRALAAGARAVVVRPFAIRDFVRALASAADGSRPAAHRPPG